MPRKPNPRQGRFYRPELETDWQRFAASWSVRVIGGVLLVAGVTTLVTIAVLRFA